MVRLHIHSVMERTDTPFRCKALSQVLHVGGIEPSHVAGTSDPSSGRKSKGTAGMHYYCQMPKRGRVCGGTNYPAFEDFLINPRWIAGYVQRQKMQIEDAKEELPPPFVSLIPLAGGF